MKHLITPIVSKTIEIIKITSTTIFPFKECASENDQKLSEIGKDKQAMNATDLFSFFTADIIKQEVIFVR